MNRSHDFTNCEKGMKKGNFKTLDNFAIKYFLSTLFKIFVFSITAHEFDIVELPKARQGNRNFRSGHQRIVAK